MTINLYMLPIAGVLAAMTAEMYQNKTAPRWKWMLSAVGTVAICFA